MATIKFRRGLAATIPTLEVGEPGWATDTTTLYVGSASGNVMIGGGGGVTSIGIVAPSIFGVSGSPVTTSGDITLSLSKQAAHTFFAGPVSGADDVPTFRAMDLSDIPGVTVYPTKPGILTCQAGVVSWMQQNAYGGVIVQDGDSIAVMAGSKGDLVIYSSDTRVEARPMSGDATLTSVGVLTIANDAVTFAKMQNVSKDVVLGATTAGDITEITCTSFARDILDDSDAAAVRTTIGAGTVTSVALSLPSILTVTGSPVTGSGTLTATLATQSANTVFAGPSSGSAASPTFRAMVEADLPVPSKGGAELPATYAISALATWEDAGLSVTLPSAGTYLLTCRVRARILNTANGSQINARLYDTTNSAVVAGSESLAAYGLAGVTNHGYTTITSPITVTGSTTIRLEAYKSNFGTYTTAEVLSAAVSRTRLEYIRIGS